MLDTIKQWHRRHHEPAQSRWPDVTMSDHVVFDPSVHTAAELVTDPARTQSHPPQHAA